MSISPRIAMLCGLLTIAFWSVPHASRGQDFGRLLEDLGRQILDPPREPPRGKQGSNEDEKYQQRSVPGESGRVNPGGDFRNGVDWGFVPDNRGTYDPRFGNRQPRDRQVRPAPPAREYSRLPIVIRCPRSEQGSCSYTLVSPNGSYAYNIDPGQKQEFKETTQWLIRYDSDGAGLKTYRLSGGSQYKLVRTDAGIWQLYRESSNAATQATGG